MKILSNKWVRSISFNKTNSQDIARLKLIGKKSFSRFIKRLLDEEIKRTVVSNGTTKTDTPQPQSRVIPPSTTKPVTPKPQVFKNPMLRK